MGYHTPRVGKVDSKEPNESNGNPALWLGQSLIQGPLILVYTLNDRDNNMAKEHAGGSNDEECLPAELVEI
jgi:hypothetical protein